MSQFKKKLTALGAFLTFVTLSSAAVYAAGVGDNTVINQTDNIRVTTGTGTQNVDMKSNAGNGAVGQVDWGRLNVASGETLRFGFSGLSQTIINRVLGGSKSEFFGKIMNGCTTGDCAANQASGKVVIINPAGILFGAGSQVDLNSLTATTFDFRGAKNLGDLGKDGEMTQAQYLDSLRQGTQAYTEKSYNVSTGKFESKDATYKYNNNLIFDRNKTDNFGDVTANHSINIEGATFDHFDADKNTNNTVAMLSDNITYKNSLIKVGDNLNYSKDTQSFGKVSLITADGASFGYLVNGSEKSHSAYAQMKNEGPETRDGAVARNILIDNNAEGGDNSVAAANRGIFGGSVSIENRAMTSEGSDIKISNAVVRADKLESVENGDIYIIGTNKVNVKDSLLSTKNTSDETVKQYGGEIYINTYDDLTVEGSQFRTAGSNYPDSMPEFPNKSGYGNTGAVRFISERGNTSVNDSIISSEGHVKVEGYSSVEIGSSAIEAKNVLNAADVKDVDIVSTGNINIVNSSVAATKDVNILSSASTIRNVINNYDLAVGGKVTIASEYAEGDDASKNLTFIKAGNNLNIRSKDTTADNATLAYTNISFHDTEFAEGVNPANNIANVTIKNNTAFDPAGTADVVLSTNGDFTFDHATAKLARGTEIVIGKDVDGTYGKLSAAAKVVTIENADSLTVHADGDLKVVNASDITAKDGDIAFTAGKNATVDGSKLTAQGKKTSTDVVVGYEYDEWDEVRDVLDDNGEPIPEKVNGQWQNKTETIHHREINYDKPIYDTVIAGGDVKIATVGLDDASVGKLSVINGSSLTANGDVILTARDGIEGAAAGSVLVDGSTIAAGNDATFKAVQDITISDSHVSTGRNADVVAGNNVTIKGFKYTIDPEDGTYIGTENEDGDFGGIHSEGNITIAAGNDTLISDFATLDTDTGEDGSIRITSGKDVTITNDSVVNTVKDIYITATTGDISVLGDSTVGGANEEGVVNLTAYKDVKIIGRDIESSVINTGDVNITAQNGGLKIATASVGGKDVNITSFKTIKFGADIDSDNILNDVSIMATNDLTFTANGTELDEDENVIGNADIIAEKTNMAELTYGKRLTFDASRDNKFTSADSLKSVNVDYVAGRENNFNVANDIQFVNSSLTAPNNNIVAGNDVILNDLEIKVATADAKDTVTRITAGGDVTTVNVTNEGSEAIHTYPNEISTDRTGTEQTILGVNGTKLFVTTSSEVKAGDNADKGSVNLNLKGTSANAGVEIIAENVGGWDKTIGYVDGVSNGPVVTITSADGNPVAVSKIITDKLTIATGTDIIASEVAEITQDMKTILGSDFPADVASASSAKGYIEVRDKGGFNQNPDPAQEPEEGTFNYVKDYGTPIPDDDDPDMAWTSKHTISYDDNKDNFILIYDKARDCETTPSVTPDPNEPTIPPTIDDRNDQEYQNTASYYLGDAVTFLRERKAENHDLNRTALPRQLSGVSDKDTFGDARGTSSSYAGAASLQATEDGGIEIITTRDIEKEEEELLESGNDTNTESISFLNQDF